MLIKILYILAIFLVVRLVVKYLKKFNELQETVNQKKTQKKKDDDIIDAEYTVLNDKKSK